MARFRMTLDDHTYAQLAVLARRRAAVSESLGETGEKLDLNIPRVCAELVAGVIDEFGDVKPLSVLHKRIDALAATNARQAEAVARLTEIAETLVGRLDKLETEIVAHRREFAVVNGETGVLYKTALAVKSLIQGLSSQGVAVTPSKSAAKPAE
jgi:hypothetical protein